MKINFAEARRDVGIKGDVDVGLRIKNYKEKSGSRYSRLLHFLPFFCR